jgi:carbon monoxide dehydrogenase subunit G
MRTNGGYASSDRKSGSRAKGSVSFVLAEENGGTRVDLLVDYTLAAALAQFNRGGIVQDLAERPTAQFTENLETALTKVPPVASAPINAGRMLSL